MIQHKKYFFCVCESQQIEFCEICKILISQRQYGHTGIIKDIYNVLVTSGVVYLHIGIRDIPQN